MVTPPYMKMNDPSIIRLRLNNMLLDFDELSRVAAWIKGKVNRAEAR